MKTSRLGVLLLALFGIGLPHANTLAQNFWEPTSSGPYAVYGLAANPSGVFAGTSTSPGFVYHSSNDGATWSLRFTAPPGIYGGAGVFTVVSGNDAEIFAGTGDLEGWGGTYRSTDNGVSWTSHHEWGAQALAVTQGGVVFAGMGVYLLRDWVQVLMSPTCGFRSVAINQDGHIFAGMVSWPSLGCSIFRSTDGGNSWIQSGVGLNVYSIVVDFAGRILAGTLGHGVFRSTDNGNSWHSTGLTGGSVFTLIVNANGHIFAGTEGEGVFRSTDAGNTWTQINSGLGNVSVYSLAIGGNGRLFAGTQNGVYRSVQTTLDVEEVAEVPASFKLMQNYPNPFNPSTTIEYSLPQRSTVEIKVLDVLGREVATLLNEEKPAGVYTVQWDAKDVASGVYFYRMQASEFVQVRKLLLVR
jgi:hypothetical protein